MRKATDHKFGLLCGYSDFIDPSISEHSLISALIYRTFLDAVCKGKSTATHLEKEQALSWFKDVKNEDTFSFNWCIRALFDHDHYLPNLRGKILAQIEEEQKKPFSKHDSINNKKTEL